MLLKKILFLSFLTCFSISVSAQSSYTDSLGTDHLVPADFKSKLEAAGSNVQLIDVRTPDEFKKSHLPEAVNINYYNKDFLENLSKVDKNKAVFIYCTTGGRSNGTAAALRQTGFKSKITVINGFYTDLGLLYGIKPEPVRRPNKF